MEFLDRTTFVRLWKALIESPSLQPSDDSTAAMRITNGVSEHLGTYLIDCAQTEEFECLAEKYKV